MQPPKFKIDNIPQGKVNMMNKSRQASAQAAVRAINQLNKQINHGYDYRSLYKRWESTEWPMATVNGKFKHEVIRNYDETIGHLDGIAYNMVRERFCNSVIEFLGKISRMENAVNRQAQEELIKVQTENTLLKAALAKIAENYVLDNHDAIAQILNNHL